MFRAGSDIYYRRRRRAFIPSAPKVLDGFNRADGDAGVNWSPNPWAAVVTNLAVVSNQAGQASALVAAKSWWNAEIFRVPMIARCVISARPTANGAGRTSWLGFVQQPDAGILTGDGYELELAYDTAADTALLRRYDNDVPTTILSAQTLGTRVQAGDKLGLSIESDGTVRATLNGATIAAVVDTTYFGSAQYAYALMGMNDPAGVVRHDDFLAESSQVIFEGVASESISISDVATRAVAYSRTASESVGSISDAVVGVVGKTRTATESVAISDSESRSSMATFRNAAESVSISDAAPKIDSYSRSASDAFSVSESDIRAVSFSRVGVDYGTISGPWLPIQIDSVANRIGVGDSASSVAGRGRTTAESIGSIIDSAARQISLHHIAVESISISDSSIRFVAVSRLATEVVSALADSLARATGYSRSAAEPMSVSDVELRGSQSLSRSASESLMIAETLDASSTGAISRSVFESIALADVVARSTQSLSRVLTDGLSVSDAALGGHGFAAFLIETISIVDSIGSDGQRSRQSAEVVGVSDSLVRTWLATRSAAEPISIADDAVVVLPATDRTASEMISISDLAFISIVLSREIAESVVVFDSIGRHVYGRRATAVLVSSRSTADEGAGILTSVPA